MKDVTVIALAQLPAAIFAVGAVYLMSRGSTGWGWCVFAALCLACTKIKVD